MSDRGLHFLNKVIEHLLNEFMVIHRKLAPFQPQSNGQVKSTNKILKAVLTKVVRCSKLDWELKLHSAIWAYRVAYKTAIGTTPFNMVYGLETILPMEFLIPTLRVAKELTWTRHELSTRLDELKTLDETRLAAVVGMYTLKRRQKKFHDSHIINKEFKLGDLVLVYTLKQFQAKFTKRGRGPCVISRLLTSGAVKLSTLDGEEMPKWINGCRIKKSYTPLAQLELQRLHNAKGR